MNLDTMCDICREYADIELTAERNIRKNHAETLRAIASMGDDSERMRQWARDALSGYTESQESLVLRLSNEREQFLRLYYLAIDHLRAFVTEEGSDQIDLDNARAFLAGVEAV